MIALDVGTRSIVCLEHDGGTILRCHYAEHAGPCMKEGNVYDLADAVASIRRVREAMDLPEGIEASIAIAGGHLVTRQAPVAVAGPGPWSEEDLVHAEERQIERWAAAKALAGKTLLGLRRAAYRVDGRPVAGLQGLEGTKGEFQLIATYLPLESVKRKLSAIEAAGFAPNRIAVEPLAVCGAVFGAQFPASLYAVVDIGAGTSDIAVVSSGGLAGVSSIPRAGDTLTDALARRLGLAYIDADRVKREPGAEVMDVWGVRRSFTPDEISGAAAEGETLLVDAIAAELERLDPDRKLEGVVLVGGGSLWPPLPARLAKRLGLVEDRVRVRRAETLPGLEDRSGSVTGPAYVTAAGILLTRDTALRPVHYTYNGETKLTVERGRGDAAFTVADAMRNSGHDPLEFFGEPGEAIESDGEIIGGEPGSEPTVRVNGERGTLDTPVPAGARIEVERGAAGAPASTTAPLTVTLDGRTVELALPRSARSLPGPERVELEIELLKEAAETQGSVTIDGHRIYCGERRRIERGGDGVYVTMENDPPRLKSLVPLPPARALVVRWNGAERTVRDLTRTAEVGGKRLGAEAAVNWDAEIRTVRGPWRVYEALPEGLWPARILVNGREADLVTEIRDGDEVTAS